MYSAAEAAWTLGSFALPLYFGATTLLGTLLLGRQRTSLSRGSFFAAIAFGTFVTTAGAIAATEAISQTWTCTSRASLDSARTVVGTVSPVEPRGNIGSQRYRFSIGSESFSSGTPGVNSECGLKASLAQTMYPPVGKRVQARIVGSTIVELKILE